MASKSAKKDSVRTENVLKATCAQSKPDSRLDKKIDVSMEKIQLFLKDQAKVSSDHDEKFNAKLKEIQSLLKPETESESKVDWLISSYMNEIHNDLRDQKNDTAKLNGDINDKLKDMLQCLREHKQADSITIKSLESKIDTLESSMKDIQLVLFESIQEVKYMKGWREGAQEAISQNDPQKSRGSRRIPAPNLKSIPNPNLNLKRTKLKPTGTTEGPVTPLPMNIQDLGTDTFMGTKRAVAKFIKEGLPSMTKRMFNKSPTVDFPASKKIRLKNRPKKLPK